MRITDVRVVSKGLPSGGPVLVEVQTDEGITGVGSTSASASVISALVEDDDDGLRSLLIGTDPTDPNMAWRRMFASGNRGRTGEGGVAVNAMGAIDMALWDIAGKAAGLPIYKLRGGAVRDRIMVYASGTAFDRGHMERTGEWRHKPTKVLVEEALENKAAGFKAMKFGWGNYFSESDYDDIEAVRDAVGPDMKLMLDFGCPAYLDELWTVKDAIQVAERLEEYDIYFFEEALNPYDVDGYAILTEHSPIRIAAGESLTTVRDFQPFIERRVLDIVQPDAQQMGLTQFVRVAERAEEAGVLCIPHGPWSAFLIAAHMQVLCTLTNCPMIEYPAPNVERGSGREGLVEAMHEKVIETPMVVKDGYLELPEGPGLGLGNFVHEVIEELTERYGGNVQQ